MTNTVNIGTSGLVLRQTKAHFPEPFKEYSRLHYYSTLFNSIEVNSTFYKLHKPKTIEKWSRDVVDNFRFSFKVWREITHAKNLAYSAGDITKFMSTLQIDPAKQGCILIQFPARIDRSFLNKVQNILDSITGHCVNTRWRICVEFRHTSWYNEEVFAELQQRGVGIVLHDIPKSKFVSSFQRLKFVYQRFHGTNGRYGGSYDESFLNAYATQIKDWQMEGKDVFVYFNNTLGTAYEDAITLEKKIAGLEPSFGNL